MKLLVYFEGQFWVGVVEIVKENKLKVCKHIFGPEPSDAEVLDFVNKKITKLINDSSGILDAPKTISRKVNPKRLQRLAAKEIQKTGISTYAQQALQLEREKKKKEKQKISKEKKEELKNRKRQLKIDKTKERHRGK